MEDSPRLWVLAGGNGAGKSTFHATRRPARHGIEFVNAGLIEREFDRAADDASEPASYRAARIARGATRSGSPGALCRCETVFSHPSKVQVLARAHETGYHVVLVFIHLADPALNVLHVRQRVSEGGHPVPTDKIVARIPRTLVHVRDAIGLADETLLLDDSRRDDPSLPPDRREARRHRHASHRSAAGLGERAARALT